MSITREAEDRISQLYQDYDMDGRMSIEGDRKFVGDLLALNDPGVVDMLTQAYLKYHEKNRLWLEPNAAVTPQLILALFSSIPEEMRNSEDQEDESYDRTEVWMFMECLEKLLPLY